MPSLDVFHSRKHLIAGNNDDAGVTGCPGWQSVQPCPEMTVDGTRLVLCHYPFRTWRDIGRGSVILRPQPWQAEATTRQFDVDVDVWDDRPVPLEQVLSDAERPSVDQETPSDPSGSVPMSARGVRAS